MNCNKHKSSHLVNFASHSILFGTVADHFELVIGNIGRNVVAKIKKVEEI